MQWFVAVGMPLALFLWFTIAYFSGLDVNNPYLAEVLVSFNILLWATISFLKIREEFGLDTFKFTSPCKTLLVALITGFLIGLLGFAFEFWKGKSYDFPGPYSSVPVFILFVVGSILEEVVWRAYVLRAFGFGWFGLFVSSLFFGLHHIGLGFKNFVFATLAGFVLGGVYMRTSLFWGVALGHVFANLIFLRLAGVLFRSLS